MRCYATFYICLFSAISGCHLALLTPPALLFPPTVTPFPLFLLTRSSPSHLPIPLPPSASFSHPRQPPCRVLRVSRSPLRDTLRASLFARQIEEMAAVSAPSPKLDRYIVVHVATTCDEHGVYVTKDSAEVIELGWILLDTKTCEEVSCPNRVLGPLQTLTVLPSCTARASSSSRSTRQSLLCAVSLFPPSVGRSVGRPIVDSHSELDDSDLGACSLGRFLP